MANFGEAERSIQQYFVIGECVTFNSQNYIIKKSGKPTCKNGEPKTDIYILLANEQSGEVEIKISYKKENADFLENKIKAERAEQLFGSEWRSLIEQSTLKIKDKFFAKPLIYKDKHKRTEKGAITLGWKFELMNKLSGELSAEMLLSKAQYLDVYAGNNLPSDKRNAFVNGEKINDSGVANYILFGNQFSSAQNILAKIERIEDYITHCPRIYFACKALNYRTFERKYDGNRPLAVQVKWNVQGRKLSPTLTFNQPLQVNGKEMKEQLLACLETLEIETTDDVSESNVEMSCVHQ